MSHHTAPAPVPDAAHGTRHGHGHATVPSRQLTRTAHTTRTTGHSMRPTRPRPGAPGPSSA